LFKHDISEQRLINAVFRIQIDEQHFVINGAEAFELKLQFYPWSFFFDVNSRDKAMQTTTPHEGA
jgi:hypothetical protein